MARDKRLTARLRAAKLRHRATSKTSTTAPREVLIARCSKGSSEGDWIDAHDNLVLVGSAGVGKSWLACAIRPQSLPRQSRRPLSSLAETLRRTGARARRRAPFAPDQGPRPRRPPHPRRLRPRAPRRQPSRPARNRQGAVRSPDRRSSLPSSLYPHGMRSSATPPTPTPSWTASSTTPIASSSPARACAALASSHPKRLDEKPRRRKKLTRPTSAAPPGGIISLQGGGIIQKSLGAIIPF